VNRYLRLLRERIVEVCEAEAPVRGNLEIDESYFGPRRVRGSVVVVLAARPSSLASSDETGPCTRRSSRMPSRRTLQAVIRGRVGVRSVIHSDAWRGYDGLRGPLGTRSTSGSGMGGTSSRGSGNGRISMASRPSGVPRRPAWSDSGVFTRRPSSATSRHVSSGLTAGRKTYILSSWTFSGDTLSTSLGPT